MKRPWSRSEVLTWLEARPLPFGCNFLPSTAVNPTEMWQAEGFDPSTIDRELTLAARTGFNALRVFLPHIVWETDPDGLKARFGTFLSSCARHGLQVLPVLFDDCAFAGREPYPGWQGDLETYVTGMVSALREDARILAWDLYNEPGNSGRRDRSLPLVERAFAWAREADLTQPLTTGAWNWIDLSRAEGYALEASDVVSLHSYLDLEGTRRRIAGLAADLGRPVLCTEWMNRLTRAASARSSRCSGRNGSARSAGAS